MATASPKQIDLIKGKLASLQRSVEAAEDGDPMVTAIEALLGTQETTLAKVMAGQSIDKRAASSAIDALFSAEKLIPPAEIRWVKEGDTFLIKGAAVKLVPGEQVTTTTRNGPKPVIVDKVVRVEGPIAFATTRRCEEQGGGTGLDLTPLFTGLTTQAGDPITTIYVADPEGTEDDRLKLQIDRPRSGRWEGWIFVKDAAEYGSGRRYGRQAPGGTYSGQVSDVLERVLADRRTAMARYGQLVGVCGRCGRKLEDKDSVALGLGPWCATQV